MALAVDGEPQDTDLDIEAVLNAMEEASPGSRAEYIGGSFTLNRPRIIPSGGTVAPAGRHRNVPA